MAPKRSSGKRKAGFLGFQSGEIAFIEDEMAALAAEYGLQVDGEVAASVSKRQKAKKARRRQPLTSTKPPTAGRTRQPEQQQIADEAERRVRLLTLQVARLEQQKAKHEGDEDMEQRVNQHPRILSKLRALLPEGGALGRCVVPGCNCAHGSRELELAPPSAADDASEDVQSDLLRLAQCKRCQHGALQHAVVVIHDTDKKRDANTVPGAVSGLPSGGQRLLSALYTLVRLVRVSGSVYASREWTRSSMALLDELINHMKRQLASGGSQNGQKSAGELQQEQQLVGELQTLTKRLHQAVGASARDVLKVELACLCDHMYFHCYYACLVLYGRGCAAVPAPDVHFRQLLAFAPESTGQLEKFLNRELVTDGEDALAVVQSLALPLAEPGKTVSDYKRSLAQVEALNTLNPLLSVFHSRLQEGVRLFYEQGIGMDGEMNAVLAHSSGGSTSAPGTGGVKSKKKLQKKHYRRERKAGDVEATSSSDKKLAEMPSYPLLAQWRDNCRDWSCHLFAYATPTVEALEVVAEYAPLVEMGAGTGYWSSLLQQRGVDIVAYDKCPPSVESGSHNNSRHKAKQQNAYHGQVPPFCSVGTGGPEVLKQESVTGRNLLLCYPPPGDEMAVNCAKLFQGDCIVHVGEWQGDTGDRRFEKELATRFRLEKEVELPNWGNSAYHLTVWRRVQSAGEAEAVDSRVMSCFGCGLSLDEAVKTDGFEDVPLKRCGLCKTRVYCSVECVAKDGRSHAAEHAKRLVFLADERSLDFGNDKHFVPLMDVATLDTSEEDAVAKTASSWRAVVGKKEGKTSGDEKEEDSDGEGDDQEEQEVERRPARAAFAFNFSA